MDGAHDSGIWSAFEEVFCLTLEGDVERQRHAAAELCRAGLHRFKFIEGISPASRDVDDAYQHGIVHAFPPCFRCGNLQCGNTDCNNTLIPQQVACFLSFIKLFRTAVNSVSNRFLLFEDDLKFSEYFQDLALAALVPNRLVELGFYGAEPCLIGLGRGKAPTENWNFDGSFEFIPGRKLPQNPCFAFNRPFAEMALARFDRISHTVDVFIHYELSNSSRHFSLEPSLAYELSTSTGELPSRIHPKAIAIENATNTPEMQALAREAYAQHIKHTLCIPLAIIGSPRCGTGYMAHALRQYGLDIGHEMIGRDGISSWLFAVRDTDLPFGGCVYSRNSKYVFPRQTIAVIRDARNAIPSLMLENTKNIQSYAFRRRWIRKKYDIDIDSFRDDFTRALAAYTFWYRIILENRPTMWIRLEHARHDLESLFYSTSLTRQSENDLSQLSNPINSNKPYMSQLYEKPLIDFAESFAGSDAFLKREYWSLRSALTGVFFRGL